MTEMTVQLPDDLVAELKRIAQRTGLDEVDVLIDSIRAGLPLQLPPKPRGGIFDSGDPHMSEKVDELLKGFGEHDLTYEPEEQ